MNCPHCLESARFVNYRSKQFISLIGLLRFARAYYHCKNCGRGHVPWDQTLRVSPQCLTLAAQEVVALAGIQESFGKAADRTLVKLAGLRVSESTVERTTESAGERLGDALERGEVFGEATCWEWNVDRDGSTCAYVSVDATGILMQGEEGAKVDGRMVNVGMIYNPQARGADDEESLAKPCDGSRYLAGLYTLEQLGEELRRQGAQVGMDQADQWIALSDGGAGLESFFDVYFPRAVKILDFHHATGYLAALARAMPSNSEEQLKSWCHTLKQEGGTKMLALLDAMDVAAMSAEANAEHGRTRTYFANHCSRMNYPEYLRRGWQIGSGSVESACKTVINQRLCQGGMRWGEMGSDAVAHLRALYRSEPAQWDAFWQQPA